MPRRNNTNDIKNKFIAAGFIPDNNFQYKNNKQKHRVFDILNNKYVHISLQTLDYNINKGHRPLWTEPALLPASESDYQPQSSFERFVRSHSKQESFQQLPEDIQLQTFTYYQQLRPAIMRQEQFTYGFDDGDIEQTSQMRAIILALHDSLPKILSKHSIRLEILNASGHQRYFHINPTTLSDLWAIFKDVEPNYEVEDSAGNFALDSGNISSITFTFKPHKQGRQVAAGFFPYINTSRTDLTRYGIYSNVQDERIAEPCLLTAFRNSGLLNDNELAQLQEMIATRIFPQTYLKYIHEHFHINIYVRHYHEEDSKSKSSHVEFNNSTYSRSVRLMILYNHYMLYEKIPGINKFNYSLIKDMIKNGELKPFSNKEYERVFGSILMYKLTPAPYNASRPIIIRPPQISIRPGYAPKQGRHFFGYNPDPTEIDYRLDELQRFINTLPLRNHIDVRSYFKFSNLMLRLMYEYGCFDNVHEFAGGTRDSIRNSLVFPGRKLTTSEINEKCYYLDFNGAFCSFMTHIPAGTDLQGRNTKISELINILYNKRLEAKASGNTKLATTLKFIMCSCYGMSIAKAKTIKHKYSENIQGTINNQGDLVISHENKDSGFVNILQPYVEYYSFPQFAKVILDGFNNKMNEIKSIVNVLFQNIDSIVVNEADYNKLLELGYVHPTELGKLKVEHVFTSMVFYNKMRWQGINPDGSIFNHCM